MARPEGGGMDGTIEIGLANDLREIAGAAARIDGFCGERGLAPEAAYAVNLAVEELLTNTITHGYDDDDAAHRIEIIVRLEGVTLVVAIVDDGTAFDPTRAPVPDACATAALEDGALGGLGLLLVNRMMDTVEYQRRAGCNVVTLTKGTAGEAGSTDVVPPPEQA